MQMHPDALDSSKSLSNLRAHWRNRQNWAPRLASEAAQLSAVDMLQRVQARADAAAAATRTSSAGASPRSSAAARRMELGRRVASLAAHTSSEQIEIDRAAIQEGTEVLVFVSELRARLREATEQSRLDTARREELEAADSNRKAVVTRLMRQNGALKKQLDEADSLESQLVTARAEIELARKESTESRVELSAVLEAKAGLEDAMEQQQVEAAQLRAELSAVLEAKAGLEDAVEQQQVEAAQLRAELSAVLEAKADLEDAVEQQQVEAAQLRAELEATGTEESTRLAAEASRELAALHEKLGDQERELDALAAQYEKVSRRAERHKSKSVRAQNEQQRLQDEGAALSFALTKTESDLVEAQHALLEQAAAFRDGEQELAKLQRAHQRLCQDLQQQKELTQQHLAAQDEILAEAERAQAALRAKLLDAQSRAQEDAIASESQLNNMRADVQAQRLAFEEELHEERSQCKALRQQIAGLDEQMAALQNRHATEALAADKRQAQLQQSLDDKVGALNRARSDADAAVALVAEQRAEVARVKKDLEVAKAETVAERSRCASVQDAREEEVARMRAEIEGGHKISCQQTT